MALASLHACAHGRQEVASPCGATPAGDRPTDGTHADGWCAGMIRGRHGRIVQHQQHVVMDRGSALLPPSAVEGGGLKREAAVDTPWQITPRLIQGGGGYGATPVVDGQGAPPSRLHPRGTHRIPHLDGNATAPERMGPTHLPRRGWVVLLRTIKVGA